MLRVSFSSAYVLFLPLVITICRLSARSSLQPCCKEHVVACLA